MRIRKEANGLLIVSLLRGDGSIRDAVEGACRTHGIDSAAISAIGGVENPQLGCYELATKTYLKKDFPGIWELLSLQGNVAIKDGQPFMHAHVSLSGVDFAAFGGHMFDAKIGLAVELFITPIAKIERKLEEPIGLACWDLA